MATRSRKPRTSPAPPRKPAPAVPPPPATAARWTPVVDDRRCCQTVSNLNPAGARDRLLVPCDRPASKTCPTCGHRYCARHFKGWHWIRDKDKPGSHGWCAASPRPKAARRTA